MIKHSHNELIFGIYKIDQHDDRYAYIEEILPSKGHYTFDEASFYPESLNGKQVVALISLNTKNQYKVLTIIPLEEADPITKAAIKTYL